MDTYGTLNNLRAAYQVLSERVRVALRTQLGDQNRLESYMNEVRVYAESAERVSLF